MAGGKGKRHLTPKQAQQQAQQQARVQQRRVRELEEQVKQLAEALQKRNPNSIANLIQAAGRSPEDEEALKMLRERVATLEIDLAEREAETATKVRQRPRFIKKLYIQCSEIFTLRNEKFHTEN